MAEPTISVLFPIFAGVTQLDFTGPLQVLDREPEIRVMVASVGGKPVAVHGMVFAKLWRLEEVEQCDVLCVPGGGGVAKVLQDEMFMRQIRRLGLQALYVTSVCTGSLILGAAGLLEGKRAACHWASRDMLSLFGAIPDPARVVRDGNVITGGGVTAGIDFGLTLLAELTDDMTAQAAQLGLEYAPAPPFQSGRPDIAPPAVLQRVMDRSAGSRQPFREAVERVAADYRQSGPRQ